MQSISKIHVDLTEELKNIINKDDQYTIPVFIPHLGCNNECVFCNQRKISGNKKIKNLEKIREDIDRHIEFLDRNKKIQIAFFGGSFTGIPITQQIQYLKLANEYIRDGKADSIRISTRPDYITIPIVKMLKRYKVKTIELGVQSMDELVLESSKRGHTSLDVIKAATIINLLNVELGFQIMIGLPNSNLKSEIMTISKLLKFKPKQLRIYPVYVLEKSQLFDMYLQNKYKPLTLEDASNRASEVIKVCKNSNVQIIRIGLQSTEEIAASNYKIIGPVSDNFAEYALSKIVLEKLEKEILNIKYVDSVDNTKRKIEMYVDKKYISIIVGPKKINKNYLQDKYNIIISVKGE
ncbi:MAG: Radical domain protein [Clostridia bacterium]|jgi:histone acetyltransferase (RNA polymerase elongator complex component)|nr:Radical domain protein [Clostridia bacterium]